MNLTVRRLILLQTFLIRKSHLRRRYLTRTLLRPIRQVSLMRFILFQRRRRLKYHRFLRLRSRHQRRLIRTRHLPRLRLILRYRPNNRILTRCLNRRMIFLFPRMTKMYFLLLLITQRLPRYLITRRRRRLLLLRLRPLRPLRRRRRRRRICLRLLYVLRLRLLLLKYRLIRLNCLRRARLYLRNLLLLLFRTSRRL